MSDTEKQLYDNFLYRYIEDQLLQYREPERKGTPRGETIGMGRTKFHSILLSLTDQTPKKIAEGLDVDYGLLRKWGTEASYKKLKNKQHTVFFHELEWFVVKRIRKELPAITADYRNPSADRPLLRDVEYTIKTVNMSLFKKLVARIADFEPMRGYSDFLESIGRKFKKADYYVYLVYMRILETVLSRKMRSTDQFVSKGLIRPTDVELYKTILRSEMFFIEYGMTSGNFAENDVKFRTVVSEVFRHTRNFIDLVSGDIYEKYIKEY